jgi:hypothetical protein
MSLVVAACTQLRCLRSDTAARWALDSGLWALGPSSPLSSGHLDYCQRAADPGSYGANDRTHVRGPAPTPLQDQVPRTDRPVSRTASHGALVHTQHSAAARQRLAATDVPFVTVLETPGSHRM